METIKEILMRIILSSLPRNQFSRFWVDAANFDPLAADMVLRLELIPVYPILLTSFAMNNIVLVLNF